MPLRRRCLAAGCPEFTTATYCRAHEGARDRDRGTTAARGYGAAHRNARTRLEAELPAPCGYCGRTIYPGERWVAAHVVDGEPAAGWMPAHGRCNEAAKVRT